MRIMFLIFCFQISCLGHAQSLNDYNGDYELSLALNACNSTARVEVNGSLVSIINQDVDNRGWSSVKLKIGETKVTTLSSSVTLTQAISLNNTDIIVQNITKKSGKEIGWTKDIYSFSDKNGKKGLRISISTEIRGNVSDYGTSCFYEKR